MNMYKAMKEKHTKEMNAFPMVFAFSDDQFIKGMDVLGVTDESDLLSMDTADLLEKLIETHLMN